MLPEAGLDLGSFFFGSQGKAVREGRPAGGAEFFWFPWEEGAASHHAICAGRANDFFPPGFDGIGFP